MALVRHCDFCDKILDRYQGFIKIELKSNVEGIEGISSGAPLWIQGEFCSIQCLDRLMEHNFPREEKELDANSA